MTIRRMRIACWIPKATGTHSEYVILTDYQLQQWLHLRTSLLRYTYIARPPPLPLSIWFHSSRSFLLRWWHGSFPRVKQPRRDADNSLLSGAEVKNEWSCASIPTCLHGTERDKFTFTLSSHDFPLSSDDIFLNQRILTFLFLFFSSSFSSHSLYFTSISYPHVGINFNCAVVKCFQLVFLHALLFCTTPCKCSVLVVFTFRDFVLLCSECLYYCTSS